MMLSLLTHIYITRPQWLTHWGRVTHICVGNLPIIGSDNGLSLGWRQAIIWNNDGILSIELLGTNFSEILLKILTFSFMKMRLKVSSAKWRPCCLGLNVLKSTINTAWQHLLVRGLASIGTRVCCCISSRSRAFFSRQPSTRQTIRINAKTMSTSTIDIVSTPSSGPSPIPSTEDSVVVVDGASVRRADSGCAVDLVYCTGERLTSTSRTKHHALRKQLINKISRCVIVVPS